MVNNSDKEYSIPNGGDFNLFCKFDKKLNLDIIKENFENHDIKCEYKISEDDMWISLYEGTFINVTNDNADEIISYLYERFPY